MSELLPCPFCGHINPKPTHHSHFMCKAQACRHWLELRKGHAKLSDYTARKAADKARVESFWHQKALLEQQKLGVDYDLAMQIARAAHDRNSQKMRDDAAFAKVTPRRKPSSRPQTFTNTTKPVVVMSTTADDDTNATF